MGDIQGAYQSLVGLAVGDALGNLLCLQDPAVLAAQEAPSGPWAYTDDTEMALSIYEQLSQRNEIQQDRLATSFAIRFSHGRGYGDGARKLLTALGTSPQGSWRSLAKDMFFRQGSYGNGGAMRVAPLGAFFHHDLEKCAEQAKRSAEVTHAHPEGKAGTIAVAIAAAHLRRTDTWNRETFFETVLKHTSEGLTREGIVSAAQLTSDISPQEAGQILGNGSEVTSQDTAPFCLWSVACGPDDFEAAFWRTVQALGDQDTTCAIVGGIIACRTPAPTEWAAQVERFPRGFAPPDPLSTKEKEAASGD